MKSNYNIVLVSLLSFSTVIYGTNGGTIEEKLALEAQRAETSQQIKAEEIKRGLYLDDSPINVYGEPLGADLFGIRFLDICTTYIIFRNIYIGRSFKDIPELQSENEKLTIMRTLAERGVTNAVEI